MQLGVVLARTNKVFQALTATMMKNPFVLVATAAVGLTAAIWALRDSTAAEEKALKRINGELEKYNRKATERKNRAVEPVTAIKDETVAEAARIRAMKDLTSLYPGIFKDRVVKIKYEIDDKAAFGPAGAAAGAALGPVSSITGALAAGKAQAERNARLTAEMMRNQYSAEKEVNRLYRERYDWSQKTGETNLKYARRTGEELKKQRGEAEQDTDDYWSKLQQSTCFADTFEQLMQNAVLSALSLKADGKMRQWYEDFAEMGENGYTQNETEEARQSYMAYLEQLAVDAEALKQATGVDFSSQTQSCKAGAYEAASQESITRLEGLYSSMPEHGISIDGGVENILESMNAALGHLQRIEENTGHPESIKKVVERTGDDVAIMRRDGMIMK